MSIHPEFPVIVRHLICGGIAMYARRGLHVGDVFLARNFVHVDGRHPVSGGEVFRCDSCGKYPNLSTRELAFEPPETTR